VIPPKGYGAVYTPDDLSYFVSRLLIKESQEYIDDLKKINIVDPACGEGSLLLSIHQTIKEKTTKKIEKLRLIGVDIDENAINNENLKKDCFGCYCFDSVLPAGGNLKNNWSSVVENINLIIANPPWSSERIYSKKELDSAGYKFNNGQYDSYVLFIELCLKITAINGYCAFILPDSLFSKENQDLRKCLCETTEICLIARLGEKLFPEINRATCILIIRKTPPTMATKTKCFRLKTEQRKQYLSGKLDLMDAYNKNVYSVKQSRFCEKRDYVFDIDVKENEEPLLSKIEKNIISWKDSYYYDRGVEISKSGRVVICPHCSRHQSYSPNKVSKRCLECKSEIIISDSDTKAIISDSKSDNTERIFVGENIHRYSTTGERYIQVGVDGIKYKNREIYRPPKMMIRKTGLGINATVDDTSSLVNQTVHICKLKNNSTKKLYYHLGLLNSRVVFYYYLKKYGENEWKSHPYITKEIIFSLPLHAYSEEPLHEKISELSYELSKKYTKEQDMALEQLVFKLYGLNKSEQKMILDEMNSLPDLDSINMMKSD